MKGSLPRPEVVTLPQLLGEAKLSVPAEDRGEDEEGGVEPDGGHHQEVSLPPRHGLAGPGGAEAQTSAGGNCEELRYQEERELYWSCQSMD